MEALLAADPVLEEFKFDHAEIARARGIPEDIVRKRFRHAELNHEADPYVQITVYDDYVAMSWGLGGVPEPVYAHLQAIQHVTGYVIYDPLTDREMQPTDYRNPR